MIEKDKFHIGLTMAGAISAGAYSAGVFDFLIEALDEWEKRKGQLRKEGKPESEWDVPCHSVILPVISGASAGGITGALGLVALADQAAGKPESREYESVRTVTTRLPRLYSAWVELPGFVNAAGGSDLLGTEDLKTGPVMSLLDTTILWQIVETALTGINAIANPRPYLSDGIHLFVTHTNMRGVPYEIKFTGGGPGQPGYPMICHADRRHYRIAGAGSATFLSLWADPDPAGNIHLATLPQLPSVKQGGAWEDYAVAALGTGAFPIGLKAQKIEGVKASEYRDRRWPIAALAKATPPYQMLPVFSNGIGAEPDRCLDYVAVDGGLIDNEPFQLARWTLMKSPPHGNDRDEIKCDRAVIMVDPFPEAAEFDPGLALDAGLLAVLKRLFPILKNQVRFKAEDLVAAMDEEIFSRYLIAPRRRKGPSDTYPVERYAIACGLLGGFGGFLSEEFRAHDYQLGRLNCHLFLKNSFAMSCANGVIKHGYGKLNLASHGRFTAAPDPQKPGIQLFQIIPLCGTAATMPNPPGWPRVNQDVVDTMVERSIERANAVVAKLTADSVGAPRKRLAMGLAWKIGKGGIIDALRWKLMEDLILRDQIDWPTAGRPEAERAVIAALADPRFDFRTIPGIMKSTKLSETEISGVISDNRYKGLIYCGERRGENNALTYTLMHRKPGWFESLPGIRHLWFGKPAID